MSVNRGVKVILIALLNVVAICYVYNNVTAEGALEQEEEGVRQTEDTLDTSKHVIETKHSETNSATHTNFKAAELKQIKIVNTNASSKIIYVNSMKNLLSVKTNSIKINK